MARIPVHIVTGPPGPEAGAFIARRCAERTDWLGLVARARHLPETPNLKSLASGCPCCTGKIVLQVTLARALRETRAVRAFVELGESTHQAGLTRALEEPPLGLSVASARPVRLPEEAGLRGADFPDD